MNPQRGRALWEALHTYAWQYPAEASADDQRAARQWLAEFAQKLRPAGCACAQEWDEMVAAVPPPLEGSTASQLFPGRSRDFYWWTVAAHDRVNRRIGRALAAPEWSMKHPLLATVLSPRQQRAREVVAGAVARVAATTG